MKLGIENRREMIVAAVLVAILLLVVVYEFMPSSSTIASTSTAPTTGSGPVGSVAKAPRVPGRHSSAASAKKERVPQSLDPTLHLAQLASTEQIKYEGSGRNIFVSQPDPVIPTPVASGTTGQNDPKLFQIPPVAAAPPIPLKFFGFASKPGEPKKIFLSKGDDVFIAGEGEIVDRRYKVVRISPTSVEIQDVVGSGPPQSIPLTLG
ncbi:MAG TPA: hypothetical protein VN911_02785 [Candidatus Acidoferrum sp.]|nr:hypothetical protein [Candidatus Acidoferrum sp.]